MPASQETLLFSEVEAALLGHMQQFTSVQSRRLFRTEPQVLHTGGGAALHTLYSRDAVIVREVQGSASAR
jgi:hypothetical protein